MAGRGGGAIVNISSWLARLGAATAYNATKGAIETLTRDWAAEFGPSGVRVNAISPGVIRDPASGEGSPEGAEAAMKGTPPQQPAGGYSACRRLPRQRRGRLRPRDRHRRRRRPDEHRGLPGVMIPI